jgi:hypothetical protein
MALTSGLIATNASTAVLIKKAGANPIKLNLHNSSGGIIYVGGANVSSANGYHLNNTESLELTLLSGNSLFGLSGSGSRDIAWFEQDI